MHVHINHMFCFAPCWGGETYWCRYLVAIKRIGEGKTYRDTPEEDWTNLTEKFKFFDEEDYKRNREIYTKLGHTATDEQLRSYATKDAYRLRPEVIEWLNVNVKDRRDKEHPKGWCCGDDAYLAHERTSLDLFFH